MELIQAAVLGVVQGLTEFLPISSSGHLVVVPWFFKWQDPGLTFDVALHLGTLAAMVLYFWKDWLDILKNWKKPLLWLIVLACIPAALFGLKYDKYFETVFRSPIIIAGTMIFMGLLMGAAEVMSSKVRELSTIKLKDSIIIGFAQVLALVPGVSRSGITITAGLFDGLTRQAAARFSFLLAMPVVAGAGMLKLHKIFKYGIPQNESTAFITGIVLSAITGFLAIKYLLRYLENHTIYVFVWYRLVLGVLIAAVYFLK
jgi:undecaprenyl-diphosphatase